MPTLAQIQQFVQENINKPNGPQIISEAAIANGVSLQQLLDATGYTEEQAVSYFRPDLVQSAGGQTAAPTSEQVNNMFGTAGQQNANLSSESSSGQPMAYNGPVIDGQQFSQIGVFANNSPDPAKALELELEHLRSKGVNPTYDQTYGWIAPVDQNFVAAHPYQEPSAFNKFLGVAIPAVVMGAAGAGLYSAYTGGAAAAGANTVLGAAAADTVAGGLGAADIAGLTQMGIDAGLSGPALEAFVSAGGMSSLTPLAGISGAPAWLTPGAPPPTTPPPVAAPAGTQAPAPVESRTLPGMVPGTTTNAAGQLLPAANESAIPNWLKPYLPAGTTAASLVGNLLAGGIGAYASSQQADAYKDIAREQMTAEQRRYDDLVRREAERFGVMTGREDTAIAKQDALRTGAQAIGAPYRGRLGSLYADPSSFLSSPEVRVPVQQGTDIMARALSAREGNPIGSGGALQQLQSYASDQLFGRLGQEKDRLGTLGGLASYNAAGASIPGITTTLPTTATAGSNIGTNAGSQANLASIGANSNIWNSVGTAAGNIFNPVQPGLTLEQLQRLMSGRA